MVADAAVRAEEYDITMCRNSKHVDSNAASNGTNSSQITHNAAADARDFLVERVEDGGTGIREVFRIPQKPVASPEGNAGFENNENGAELPRIESVCSITSGEGTEEESQTTGDAANNGVTSDMPAVIGPGDPRIVAITSVSSPPESEMDTRMKALVNLRQAVLGRSAIPLQPDPNSPIHTDPTMSPLQSDTYLSSSDNDHTMSPLHDNPNMSSTSSSPILAGRPDINRPALPEGTQLDENGLPIFNPTPVKIRDGLGLQVYRCNLCSYATKSPIQLEKHFIAHTQVSHICKYCQKAFERPSDLRNHEERHRLRLAATGTCSLSPIRQFKPSQPKLPPRQNYYQMQKKKYSQSYYKHLTNKYTLNRGPKLERFTLTSSDEFLGNSLHHLHPQAKQTPTDDFQCDSCAFRCTTTDGMEAHKKSMHISLTTRLDTYKASTLMSTSLIQCKVQGDNVIQLVIEEPTEEQMEVYRAPHVSVIHDLERIQNKLRHAPSSEANIEIELDDGTECTARSNSESSGLAASLPALAQALMHSGTTSPGTESGPAPSVHTDISAGPAPLPAEDTDLRDPVETLQESMNEDNLTFTMDEESYIMGVDSSSEDSMSSQNTTLVTLSLGNDSSNSDNPEGNMAPDDLPGLPESSALLTGLVGLSEQETSHEASSTSVQPPPAAPSSGGAADDGVFKHPSLVTGDRDSYRSPGKALLGSRRFQPKAPQSGKYQCDKCSYATGFEHKMDQHARAHKGRWICKKCPKAFIKLSDLTRHWACHSELYWPDGTFPCDTCTFRTRNRDVMELHMKRHYCMTNNMKFSLPTPRNRMEKHVSEEDVQADMEAERKAAEELRLNISVSPMVPTGEPSPMPPTGDPSPAAPKGDPWISENPELMEFLEDNCFYCDDCGAGFNRKGQLMRHRVTKHRKRRVGKYICNVCGKGLHTQQLLSRHLLKHKDHPELMLSAMCQYCNQSFSSVAYKIQHEKLHTRSTAFACKGCGANFSISATLKRHTRTCLALRNATEESGQIVPLNTHDQENYECKYCNKRCCTIAYKLKHEQLHLRKTAFVCKCGVNLAGAGILKRHLRKCPHIATNLKNSSEDQVLSGDNVQNGLEAVNGLAELPSEDESMDENEHVDDGVSVAAVLNAVGSNVSKSSSDDHHKSAGTGGSSENEKLPTPVNENENLPAPTIEMVLD